MIHRKATGFLMGLVIVTVTTLPRLCVAQTPTPPADLIVLRHCLAEFDRTATLGANQAGILKSCDVGLGDRVKAGQILGRVQDEDLLADLALKKAEASSDVEIRMDEKTQQWNEYKLKMLEPLRQKQFTSIEEYGLQKTVTENAALAVEASKHRRLLAELKYKVAEAGVAMRQFVTPIDGLVVQVFKTEGESIAWNDPVFRIVDPSVVRITGELDVTDAWRVSKGDRVRASAEIDGTKLPIEGEEFTGQVAFVARELNIEHETCLVVALVENRGELLRSGLWCRMAIEPGSAPKAVAEGGPDKDAKANEPKSRQGTSAGKPLTAHGIGALHGGQSSGSSAATSPMGAPGGRLPGSTLGETGAGSRFGRNSILLPSTSGTPRSSRSRMPGMGMGAGAGSLGPGMGRARGSLLSGSR